MDSYTLWWIQKVIWMILEVELLFGKAIGYGEFSQIWVALSECHTKEINKEQETIQPLLSWSPVW